jgi:hypothetical protein
VCHDDREVLKKKFSSRFAFQLLLLRRFACRTFTKAQARCRTLKIDTDLSKLLKLREKFWRVGSNQPEGQEKTVTFILPRVIKKLSSSCRWEREPEAFVPPDYLEV